MILMSFYARNIRNYNVARNTPFIVYDMLWGNRNYKTILRYGLLYGFEGYSKKD